MSAEDTINPKCPLCNTSFGLEENPPLLLHCGHTYCQECIENKLMDSKCTKCHAIIPSDWPLPKNFALVNIDRDLKHMPSSWSNEDLSRYKIIVNSFCSRLTNLETDFDKLVNIEFKTIGINVQNRAEVKTMLGLVTAIPRYQMNSRPKGISYFTSFKIGATLAKTRREFDRKSPSSKEEFFNVREHLNSIQDEDSKYWMLKAIHRHGGAYVGAEVNGILRWGEVKKLHDAILVGVLTSINIPLTDTVLLKLKWVEELAMSSRMVYFELELNQKDLSFLRRKAPNFPETFILVVQLLPDFMDIPLARQLYDTCTGENGISYVNSDVSVNKNTITVDNTKLRYPLLNVPDDSKEWSADPGSVLGSPVSYGYTNFSITRSRIRTKETLLGYIHSDLSYFKYNTRFVVKSCGTIVFPNDMHCIPDITNDPRVNPGFDFPCKSVEEIFQIESRESKSEDSSSSPQPRSSDKK